MLENDGNAYDAALAAVFAASVTEPMLTSLAGGGVALIRSPGEETRCIDFLPAFPKNALGAQCKRPVHTDAGTFCVGHDTIATPGTLVGLLHIHKKHGRLGLDRIVGPAARYAEQGVPLASVQAYICDDICREFCTYTSEGREIFAPSGRMLIAGETIMNRNLAAFLNRLGKDETAGLEYYHEAIRQTIEGSDCSLSAGDLESYSVLERDPIELDYRGHSIFLCPPPSAGGILIAHALSVMREKDLRSMGHNSYEHIDLLVKTMEECSSIRTEDFYKDLHKPGFWKAFLSKPDAIGSTTHISVTDEEGNAIGITTSNGTSSGVAIKGTGILMNNFVGEPDLMQHRDSYKPGDRIASMMCPTMISNRNGLEAVLGTGGSDRIRSAILQVVSNLIDFGMGPQNASDASRIHYSNDLLQMEPGIDRKVADDLSERYKVKMHEEKKYYFGGVHIATLQEGAGDHRRDGFLIKA